MASTVALLLANDGADSNSWLGASEVGQVALVPPPPDPVATLPFEGSQKSYVYVSICELVSVTARVTLTSPATVTSVGHRKLSWSVLVPETNEGTVDGEIVQL